MSDKPLTDVCFENFSLHPELLKGLEAAGFIRCTPIQALTLPLTLEGKDVAGQAQTGTGKTAAFLVSMFNRLLTKPARADRKANEPRAVILAPTRELAIQIDKDARQIGRDLGLRRRKVLQPQLLVGRPGRPDRRVRRPFRRRMKVRIAHGSPLYHQWPGVQGPHTSDRIWLRIPKRKEAARKDRLFPVRQL